MKLNRFSLLARIRPCFSSLLARIEPYFFALLKKAHYRLIGHRSRFVALAQMTHWRLIGHQRAIGRAIARRRARVRFWLRHRGKG